MDYLTFYCSRVSGSELSHIQPSPCRQVHTSGANFLIRQSVGGRGVGGVDGEPVETLCVGFSRCHNTAKEAFKSSVALIQSSIKSHVQQGAVAANFSEPQARDRRQLPSHMSTATVAWKRPYFPRRLPTTAHGEGELDVTVPVGGRLYT